LTLSEAYDVQAEVARLRCQDGDAVAGHKIGCIGPGVVEQFGMAGPIYARLFESECRRSGAVIRHENHTNLAIEGEMAVRIGAGGAIVAAFPVIELHNFVFRAPRTTLAELVANNGINAGVVVPNHLTETTVERWLGAENLSVEINGRTVASGPLWAFPGGPEEAVAWLRSNLGLCGRSPASDDLVLTGTALGLYPVKPDDRVVVKVDDEIHVACFIA
jgi:2-keto-4-pentenoate hydratase